MPLEHGLSPPRAPGPGQRPGPQGPRKREGRGGGVSGPCPGPGAVDGLPLFFQLPSTDGRTTHTHIPHSCKHTSPGTPTSRPPERVRGQRRRPRPSGVATEARAPERPIGPGAREALPAGHTPRLRCPLPMPLPPSPHWVMSYPPTATLSLSRAPRVRAPPGPRGTGRGKAVLKWHNRGWF
jgi:hypothetical protein